MNIKISNDSPTQYIMIAMMNYFLEPESDESKRFGFAFFELDDRPVLQINQFLDNWQKGKRDFEEVSVYLSEFYLIQEKYIYDEVYDNENPDYKGIRPDSINFLKERPVLDPRISKPATGLVIVNPVNFFISGESMISSRSWFSNILYRSAFISYWKINHLLKRERPI